MTPTQREAALRLADDMDTPISVWADHVAHLLRELASEPVQAPQGEPVAWPARHVSLKQRKDKTLRLTLDLNAVEGWPNYWVMRSDSRGKCSTPSGCAAHGCHGECLQTAPQQRKPLTDKEIIALPAWDDYMGGCITLLDFARAIEEAHGVTGEPT